MPSLSTLRREAVWGAQTVPDNLNNLFIKPLRKFYKMGAASIGAPGDENHLYGRHRSYDWCKGSRFCTNPEYGTTDDRDQAGDRDWYRAVDIGITGQTLRDACKRLDKAVRAGKLPGLAEWFGTVNGTTVTGWYQGHKSSSDSSHLWHLHVGLWTRYANDPDTLRTLYAVITGTGDQADDEASDDDTSEEDDEDMAVDPQAFHDLVWTVLGIAQGNEEIVIPQMPGGAAERRFPNETAVKLDRLLDALSGAEGASGDLLPVIAAIRAEGTQTRGVVGDLKDVITQKEVEGVKLRLDLSNALRPPTD